MSRVSSPLHPCGSCFLFCGRVNVPGATTCWKFAPVRWVSCLAGVYGAVVLTKSTYLLTSLTMVGDA